MPFRFLNIPGCLTASPFLSFTIFPEILSPSRLILPASLKSNAIALALLEDVEFKLILYAIKKSRAEIAVNPDLITLSLKLFGP